MNKILLIILMSSVAIIGLSTAAFCQYRRRIHNDLRVIVPIVPRYYPPTSTYDSRLVYLEGRILQLGDRLYEDEQTIRDLELRVRRLEDDK